MQLLQYALCMQYAALHLHSTCTVHCTLYTVQCTVYIMYNEKTRFVQALCGNAHIIMYNVVHTVEDIRTFCGS